MSDYIETIKLIPGDHGDALNKWLEIFFTQDTNVLERAIEAVSEIWYDMDITYAFDTKEDSIADMKYKAIGDPVKQLLIEWHEQGYCWDAVFIQIQRTYSWYKAIRTKNDKPAQQPLTSNQLRAELRTIVANDLINARFPTVKDLADAGVKLLSDNTIKKIYHDYVTAKDAD